MRYENMTKRILSLVLAVAMLVSFLPAVQWVVEAEASEIATVASDRSTKYLSSSTGGSAYLGYGNSANKPEKVSASNLPSKIKSYLGQGYNVMLKRGDIWYLPTGSLSLKDIIGTEDSPVVLGAYGDESLAMPTIAYMKKIENTAWTVVDSANNIYKANVSSMTERNETGIRVYRLFVNNEAYTHYVSSDYTTVKPSDLPEGQYYDYDGTLYVRTNGGAPTNVEVTPYVNADVRLSIKNTSYLTIENIHFKGSNVTRPMIQLTAPTSHVKLDHCDITHCNYYVLQIIAGSDTAEINYKPEISNCYIDACFSEGEGAKNNDGLWNVGITEGITMREGVDGAWIHHNTIRNMSHAFIAIESLDRETYYNTTGVRNCIIEDNILEGANAKYARAFNICGGFNQSGVQMCYNNIYRRNKCYDMTTSSHLYGENNLIYSNLFSYVHCNYDENGKLFDGKGAQPWGFDSVPWNDHTSVGNMVINNTFYDMGGGIVLDDSAFPESRMYDNIYANNLIINYNNENQDYSGGIYDGTSGMNYVMNNGIYSAGRNEDYYVNGTAYRGESVNQVVGYRGNLSGNPKFATADLSVTGFGKRQTFDLSSESPYCYAGLALKADVYSKFPMYAKLLSDYTDINGNPYNPDAPSVGAYSYGASTGSKANIMEVTSTIPAVSIVPKYKEYWGNSWKEALGNQDIQVKTSDGKTATVAVDWDYTPLGDLSIFGKYTITGKLVSNVYNNPNNITVQRTVYIQEETGNLMHNGTFDKDYSSWYCGQNPVVTNGIMQLTLKSTTSHQWNVMYSRGYNSSSTTGNWAKTLADNVAKVGAGQYYLGFDSKWVTVMQDISSLGIYLQLDGYNTYNQSITTNLMKGEVKNNMQASNSGKWETVSNIVDLSGEDAFLRASVIVYHGDAKFTGQVIQLDNLKLFPLKINLNLPANLQQPTFSSVTAAKDGSNMNLTFKVPANSFGTTFTNPYVMVNYKGQNYKITSYTVSNNQYVFSFTDKAAYPLDTAVTATLCYTYGNNVISSEPYAYYAKDYCKENGHDYKVTQSTKPTCTEPGKTSYVCAACGDSYTQTVSATGHTSAAAVRENEIAATCIGSGSYDAVVYCSVCSLELSRKTVTTAATGVHTYDNSADIDCNVCGAVREKVSIVSITSKLPALGVVVNYDSYVADWETGLGLASQATVILSNGTETTVDIVWDYSTLNLKKLGKYKVVGEVISAQYSNPKNLTVEQVIYVVEKTNLFVNGDFANKNAGWYVPGLGTLYTEEFARGTGYAGWIRGTLLNSDNKPVNYRQGYNYGGENSTDKVAERVTALGAGQYYFGAYSRVGNADVPVDFQTQLLYRYGDQTSTPSGQKPTGNKLDALTTEYQLSSNVVDLPAGITYVSIRFTYNKTNADVAFDDIGVYVDDIELIPLKVAYVEPAECAHEWDEGVVDPDATCTKDGVITYTCALCNETKTDVIPATGEHAWDEGVIKPDATCTEAGVKTYTCGTCGETKTEAVSALGHTKAEPVVENEKAPTCVEAGSYESVVYCSVCKAELSRETLSGDPATGEHTYDNDQDADCNVCGAEREIEPAECEHAWDDGVETIPAGRDTKGERTYTCGKCGETKKEEIPALLRFASWNVTLKNNIQVNFIGHAANLTTDGYTDMYAVITIESKTEGVTTEVTVYQKDCEIDSQGRPVFSFTELAPDMLSNKITATLYAKHNGREYVSAVIEKDVTGYVDSQLEKLAGATTEKDKKLRTLMVDLLNYATAVQEQSGYKKYPAINSVLTETEKSWASNQEVTAVKDTNLPKTPFEGELLVWKTASLSLGDAVIPYFKFECADLTGITIEVECAGSKYEYACDLAEEWLEWSASDSRYRFNFIDLGVTRMREPIYLTAYKDGVAVSHTLTYSVQSYCDGKLTAGTTLNDVCIAMLKYGDAAKAYVNCPGN